MAEYLIPAIRGIYNDTSWSQNAYIIPYSLNTFRLLVDNDDTAQNFDLWGSSYYDSRNDGLLHLEFEIWT